MLKMLLSTSQQGNIAGLTREERLEMVGKMAASEPEQKLTRLMVCAQLEILDLVEELIPYEAKKVDE